MQKSIGFSVDIDGTKYKVIASNKFDGLPAAPYYLKIGTANTTNAQYVTNPKNAQGYIPEVAEVKPKVKTVTIQSASGGDVYDESLWDYSIDPNNPGEREIKSTIKNTPIVKSCGGEAYDASKWTWNKTTTGSASSKPYINDGTQHISITNLNGGEAYDASKWTWQVDPAHPGAQETKPSIQNNEITSGRPGDNYDASKWTWTKTRNELPVLNSKFGNVYLSSILPEGTNSATKIAVIDDLLHQKKLTISQNKKTSKLQLGFSSKSDFNTRYGNAIINSVPWDTDKDTTLAKSGVKEKIYDELAKTAKFDVGRPKQDPVYTASYKSIQTSYTIIRAANLTPPSNQVPAGFNVATDYKPGNLHRDPTYIAYYSNTKIVKYNLTVATQPLVGAVPQTFDPTTYHPGQAATKDIYTPSYHGTPITDFNQEVVFNSPAPTGAPSQYKPTDYNSGSAELKKGVIVSYKGTKIPTLTEKMAFNSVLPSKGTEPISFSKSDYNKGVKK